MDRLAGGGGARGYTQGTMMGIGGLSLTLKAAGGDSKVLSLYLLAPAKENDSNDGVPCLWDHFSLEQHLGALM